MNNHIERTKRMIEVMQAYVDGEKIENKSKNPIWDYCINNEPNWNWEKTDYRIAKTPDTINWDHVAPEFKYMARDKNGFGYLYKDKPYLNEDYWDNDSTNNRAEHFTSYRKGTVDWKESLVIRPGCE